MVWGMDLSDCVACAAVSTPSARTITAEHRANVILNCRVNRIVYPLDIVDRVDCQGI